MKTKKILAGICALSLMATSCVVSVSAEVTGEVETEAVAVAVETEDVAVAVETEDVAVAVETEDVAVAVEAEAVSEEETTTEETVGEVVPVDVESLDDNSVANGAVVSSLSTPVVSIEEYSIDGAGTAVVATWKPVAGAEQYEVVVRRMGATDDDAYATTYYVTDSAFSISDVDAAYYTITVRAINANTVSDWCATQVFTVNDTDGVFALVDINEEPEWADAYRDVLAEYKYNFAMSNSRFDLYDVDKDSIPELFLSYDDNYDDGVDIYTFFNNDVTFLGYLSWYGTISCGKDENILVANWTDDSGVQCDIYYTLAECTYEGFDTEGITEKCLVSVAYFETNEGVYDVEDEDVYYYVETRNGWGYVTRSEYYAELSKYDVEYVSVGRKYTFDEVGTALLSAQAEFVEDKKSGVEDVEAAKAANTEDSPATSDKGILPVAMAGIAAAVAAFTFKKRK